MSLFCTQEQQNICCTCVQNIVLLDFIAYILFLCTIHVIVTKEKRRYPISYYSSFLLTNCEDVDVNFAVYRCTVPCFHHVSIDVKMWGGWVFFIGQDIFDKQRKHSLKVCRHYMMMWKVMHAEQKNSVQIVCLSVLFYQQKR